MKLISWNVNGLRAIMNKGFLDFFLAEDADFFCLQETKLQANQIHLDIEGYTQYWNYAQKKGYSGTAIFAKHRANSVQFGLPDGTYNDEGRIITLEYNDFYLVTIYAPNSQEELARLPYRMQFEDAVRVYLNDLDRKKAVILCGDLNVAHQEIDIKNPKSNVRSAGFSIEEREKFSLLLESGFLDTFRSLYPATIAYTWWSYFYQARSRNVGWRIDYFVTSSRLLDDIQDALIYQEIQGSDHCPVGLIVSDSLLG